MSSYWQSVICYQLNVAEAGGSLPELTLASARETCLSEADPPMAENLRPETGNEIHDFCGISVAETADEFVRLVRQLLDNPKTKEQKQAISNSVKDETWELKVRRIVGLINEVRAAAALEGDPRELA